MNAETIFLLKNPIQPYSWGHKRAFRHLFSIDNPQCQPQAEIWMGAHPKAPSQLRMKSGRTQPLDQFIAREPELALGDDTNKHFQGHLPFLFKVLSAAQPLSIQAHPNKQQAQEGFVRENNANLAMGTSQRNYRDANHKPELIYALTPFKAMCGFRPIADIVKLFSLIDNPSIVCWLESLEHAGCHHGLKTFYQRLISVDGENRRTVLDDVVQCACASDEPALQEVLSLYQYYPDDIGILSPLLLNIVQLLPGQALFLNAGTLHAYLSGTGLEIMANSDNVLRGGLTTKHVDIPELLKTIVFKPSEPTQLAITPVDSRAGVRQFPVPVADFDFSVINTGVSANDALYEYPCHCAEILFCICGHFVVRSKAGQTLRLHAGQSCFVMASTQHYAVSGRGQLARAST